MDDSAGSFSELVPPDTISLDRRSSAANAELEYLLQLRHHLNAAFELFENGLGGRVDCAGRPLTFTIPETPDHSWYSRWW